MTSDHVGVQKDLSIKPVRAHMEDIHRSHIWAGQLGPGHKHYEKYATLQYLEHS